MFGRLGEGRGFVRGCSSVLLRFFLLLSAAADFIVFMLLSPAADFVVFCSSVLLRI